MKQREKAFLGMIILGILCTGCSRSEILDSKVNSSFVEDPMKQSETNSKSEQSSSDQYVHSTPSMRIRYGTNFTNEDIHNGDGKLILTPRLLGDTESTNVGYFIFIDGILQEYSADSSNKTYMSKYDTIPDGETALEFAVDGVIDGENADHYLNIVSMLCPDFSPNSEHPQFGFYHNVLSVGSEKILTNDLNCIYNKELKIMRIENTMLNREQKERFCQGDIDNEDSFIYGFELAQREIDSKNSRYYLPANESSLTLTFDACSSEPYLVDYRVTFFKNHMPCKFNGDRDFLDFTMEGRKISETQITIDDIEVGDVIYCIAVPLGDEVYCQVLKSASCLVIGENDKILPGDNNASR